MILREFSLVTGDFINKNKPLSTKEQTKLVITLLRSDFLHYTPSDFQIRGKHMNGLHRYFFVGSK